MQKNINNWSKAINVKVKVEQHNC